MTRQEWDALEVERVARRLCEIRGINPDEIVAHGAEGDGSGFVPAICLYSPRWTRVAREVRSRLEMDAALTALGHMEDGRG